MYDISAALIGSGRVGVWLPEWLPTNDAGAFDKFAQLQLQVRHMRCDVYGTWRQTTKKDGTKGSVYDQHLEPLTDAHLCRHLAGEIALGLYLMQPGSDTTLFAAYDIDDHAGTVPRDKMAAVATRLASAAKQRGLYASAARSGGGRGIHLLFRWDWGQVARDVRNLMVAILEDEALADGADGIEIEVFPKQDEVAPDGFGNLFAVSFGRESKPLNAAMEPIDKPLLWGSSMSVPASEDDDPEPEPDFPPDTELVRQALTYIPAEDHKVWVDVGLALKHDFGDAGYLVWIEWSKTCPEKFKKVENPEKIWQGLKPREKRPITCGSIYRMAMKAGWSGPHNYEERNGGFYWVKRTDGDETRIKLSNVTVKIAEDLTIDDGSDYRRRTYMLESKRGRAPVDAEKFPTLTWVEDIMGAKAVITPGPILKAHLVAAIKHLSKPVERTIYGHFGWRKIGGNWVYLNSSGAIGAEGPVQGVEVEPGNTSLSAYALPPVHDIKAAIQASLSLVELAPAITWPLLAAVYRAPLGEWCPVTTSLLLTGPTGERKTTVAMLALAHYGTFLRPPAEWISTANALERMTFVTKDGVLLIDDYAPKALRGDAQLLNAKAERVFRGAANRKGRDRLNQRLTFQPEYYPRCLVLATAEDVPMGESLRARIVIVEVGKGSIPIGDKLDTAQAMARQGLYAEAMAGYIQWLAGQDQLRAQLADRQAALRKEATGPHARTPENTASLMLGIETLLRYAVKTEAITAQQKETYRKEAWDVLCKQAKGQGMYLAEETPVERFLTLIRAVISSGRGHVCTMGGCEPITSAAVLGWRARQVEKADGESFINREPQGRTVGWLDKANLYLDPETAYAEVQLLASAEGVQLGLGAKELWKRLEDAKLLVSTEKDHQTIRRLIAGAKLRVLHLNSHRVLGLGEPPKEEKKPEGKPEGKRQPTDADDRAEPR
jgi:hypothetical protein